MAIQSKTAVENEYATKRTAILAYTNEQLDTELDSLIRFAAKLRELATLLRAKEAINGNPVNTQTVVGITQAAESIAATPEQVRGQFRVVKELLADPAETPIVPGP